MNMFSSLVVIVVVLCVVDVISVEVATFTPIDSDVSVDYQRINWINIDPSCDSCSVPNTIFTIFPSNKGDGVTVETSPANLVTATNNKHGGNNLSFEWNTDVSFTATSGGGVRIGIPSDQLQRVSVGEGHNAQIVDGFTTLRSLHAWDGSSVRASMMSLSSYMYFPTDLILLNYGGQMYVQTNIPVTDHYTDNGGQTWVETPSFNGFAVRDTGSQLNIKGDLDVSTRGGEIRGGLSDGAQLTLTGTITGTIQNEDNSTVNAPSCDNVISSDGSTCNAGPQSVDVDVGDISQKSQILTGINTFGGEDSSSSPFSVGATATVVVVTVVTATLI